MESVYPMCMPTIKHICIGNVPNHTNGSLPSAILNTGTIGAHIALDINVKDCVER